MNYIISEDQLKKIVYSTYDAVLIGGLDYRKGDYPIDRQVGLLNQSYSGKVKGFRYNASDEEILKFLDNNPNIDVFMFSAGCNKANKISKSPNVKLNRIFIIEPYAVNGNSNVSKAVANGVPASNVFVGGSSARGKGVVSGASSSKSDSHWGALKNIGNLI
jgi:hypothetical protein